MARRQHWIQTIYTIASHNAILCQDDTGEPGDGGGGRTARYRSRNSPETKGLFFAATQEMCAFSLFIHSFRTTGLRCLHCFSWCFRLFLLCRKFCETFQIGTVTIADFDSDSVPTLISGQDSVFLIFHSNYVSLHI